MTLINRERIKDWLSLLEVMRLVWGLGRHVPPPSGSKITCSLKEKAVVAMKALFPNLSKTSILGKGHQDISSNSLIWLARPQVWLVKMLIFVGHHLCLKPETMRNEANMEIRDSCSSRATPFFFKSSYIKKKKKMQVLGLCRRASICLLVGGHSVGEFLYSAD